MILPHWYMDALGFVLTIALVLWAAWNLLGGGHGE